MDESCTMAATPKEARLDWHSAFFIALKAELVDYLDVLQFEQEHLLNQQPLRIDAIVIKAPPNVVIKKNIAESFKGHNIIEYKSPEDSLSISDYIKVLGYACLYQAIESVDYTDITVTMVCTMRPAALLHHLHNETQGRTIVTEKQNGIYVVSGELFPVQIIESKRLPAQENAWLKSLKEDADRIALENALQLNPTVGQKVNMGAFWHVVASANTKMIMEVFRMKLSHEQAQEKWAQFFEEIGYTEELEAKAFDKTLAILRGLRKNIPPAQLSADMGVPLERVQRLQQEVFG